MVEDSLGKDKLPHDASHGGVVADGSPLGHIRKSRTRSKPVPLSLADQRCQSIVHKVHPVFTLSPQQHGTKGSLLQMNETLPAHALSLRYDRVKEALGSVLPHRTLSRGLSICSGLAHLHIARSSLIICELLVSYLRAIRVPSKEYHTRAFQSRTVRDGLKLPSESLNHA